MGVHLSKEQELHLGGVIQAASHAREALATSTAEVTGVSNDATAALNATIAAGDLAVAKLLDANSGLVWDRARAFKSKYPASPELEDLVQEGFVGLLKAAAKYDPARGNKFSTVAYYWIEQSIGRSVSNTGRLVRLPENRVQDFINISRARKKFEDSHLSTDEIDRRVRAELNLSLAEFMDITAAAATPASLNKRVSSDDSGGRELMDYVADQSTSESSEAFTMKSSMFSILNENLAELSEMEQAVVASSFMVDGLSARRQSVKEIREKYNLTHQKFKKILQDSLAKIKSNLADLDITYDDFLD